MHTNKKKKKKKKFISLSNSKRELSFLVVVYQLIILGINKIYTRLMHNYQHDTILTYLLAGYLLGQLLHVFFFVDYANNLILYISDF
jgi:hypothetical protein